MRDTYSICVNLNLFELDRLLSLLEEKEAAGEDKTIYNKIYKKLEEYMDKIVFNKKDDVTEILRKQRNEYIRK